MNSFKPLTPNDFVVLLDCAREVGGIHVLEELHEDMSNHYWDTLEPHKDIILHHVLGVLDAKMKSFK